MLVQWQAATNGFSLRFPRRSAPTRSIPAGVLVFLGVEGLRRPQTHHNLPSHRIAFGSWARAACTRGASWYQHYAVITRSHQQTLECRLKDNLRFGNGKSGYQLRADIQANVASQDAPTELAVARPKGHGQRTGRSLDAVGLRIQPFVGHCRIRHSRPWRIQYDQTSGWNLLTEIARELYD